jgi:hypothetical protein
VTLYEIFDKTTQLVLVHKYGCDEPLMVSEYPFYGQDGPYSFLRFFDDNDNFWAIPYADTFSDLVEVLNKMRTHMFDHLQRFGARKGIYQNGALMHDDADRIANAKNGELIQIQTTEDVNKVLFMLPDVPISGDAWRLQGIFESDLNQTAGVDEMALGSGRSVNTATEASYIQNQSGLRHGDMRGTFEDALRDSGKKDLKILRQFWGADRVVPIVGPDGMVWDQYRLQKAELDEVDLDLEVGSTERVDKNVRARQTIDAMAQLPNLIPLLQQQGYMINAVELAKTYLRNTDVFKNSDRILIPLPPPPQIDPNTGQPIPQAQGGMMQEQGMMDPSQMAGPASVNMMGQMMGQSEPSVVGRGLSEILSGGGM